MQEIKKYINKLINKPLTADFLYDKMNKQVNIYTYEDITKFNNIDDAFGKYHFIIILFETKNNFGHYTLLTKYKNTIEFFDSYGKMSNVILKHIPSKIKIDKNMIVPHLTYLLWKSKKKIEYNDHKLQDGTKPNISTCGYWCIVRSYYYKKNINSFAKMFKNNKYLSKDEQVILLFCILDYNE